MLIFFFTPQFFFYYTLGKDKQHIRGLDMIFLKWLIQQPWYNPISFILSDMQLLDKLEKISCCWDRKNEREVFYWKRVVAVFKFLQLSQDRTNYWVKTPLGKHKMRWKLISQHLITSLKWWEACCCICIDSGKPSFTVITYSIFY